MEAIDDLLTEVDAGLSRYERMLALFKNEKPMPLKFRQPSIPIKKGRRQKPMPPDLSVLRERAFVF